MIITQKVKYEPGEIEKLKKLQSDQTKSPYNKKINKELQDLLSTIEKRTFKTIAAEGKDSIIESAKEQIRLVVQQQITYLSLELAFKGLSDRLETLTEWEEVDKDDWEELEKLAEKEEKPKAKTKKPTNENEMKERLKAIPLASTPLSIEVLTIIIKKEIEQHLKALKSDKKAVYEIIDYMFIFLEGIDNVNQKELHGLKKDDVYKMFYPAVEIKGILPNFASTNEATRNLPRTNNRKSTVRNIRETNKAGINVEVQRNVSTAPLKSGGLLQVITEKTKKIGVTENQLLKIVIGHFTDRNLHIGIKNIKNIDNSPIPIDRKDLLQALGYDLDNSTSRTRGNSTIRKAFNSLRACRIKINSPNMQLDSTPIADVKFEKNYIRVGLSPMFAERLLGQPITPINKELLKISGNDANHYRVGDGLNDYYNIPTNVQSGTNDRLKVKTILSYTTLRSYEDIKAKGSWTRDIKEPTEKILDDLVKKYKFLKYWSYEESKNNFNGYEDWANTLIFFKLITPPYEKKVLPTEDKKDKKALKK